MPNLPEPFRRFERENGAVVKAYEALGETCAKAGPLDARTRELVKLGMAIGGGLGGGSPPPPPPGAAGRGPGGGGGGRGGGGPGEPPASRRWTGAPPRSGPRS